MAVGNPISLTDNVASRIVSQIATASQTDFTISGGYRLNAISVYRNGVRLVSGRDYSAADGSTVVLLSPATVSDSLEFHIFDDFRVADAIVSNASHQNIEGNLTVTGILTASNLIGSNLELQSLTVTNDVSIGGTLTYQDVTNIDSVGIITARTDVHVGAGLSVVGVSTFNGNAIFNGNVDLGNASGDTITATGRFDSDLIPSVDDQKDLGSSNLEWKDLYLDGTANIDTLSVSGNSTFTGAVGIADSIFHIGDNNTNIRFPATDTFTVETSGSERLRIDSDGRLGIGGNGIGSGLGVYLQRSSPNTTHFYEASDGTKKMITGVDSTNDYVKIGALSNHRLGLVANNGEKVSILPGGNIGIGKTNPESMIHLSGTSTTAKIHIDSTSNGSTTVAPGAGLLLTAKGMNTNAKFTPSIQFGSTDPQLETTNPKVGAAINAAASESYTGDNDGGMHLAFYTTPSNPGATQTIIERLRITSGGLVGIGTDNPNRKLVISQANSTAYSGTDFDQDYHVLKLNNFTDSKTVGMQFLIGDNGEAAITATETSDGATDLIFGTRGSGSRAERLRITSAGLVGIGTDNPSAKLEVSGDAKVTETLTTGLVNLDTIAASKSDTATDIFVYDTSKDSDGGAWRKRTKHTSWYNEAASTTRGSRKEFPAVAVIVAEATKVTIYDGDDPDLPLWMAFNLLGSVGGNSNMLPRGGSGTESDVTSIACLNGRLVVGLKDVSGTVGEGLIVIDFISELARVHRTEGSGYTGAIYGSPISGRNSNNVYSGDYNVLAIVAETINDVAMTVLPNAPIDATTGLPIPTIAVGTEAGVSVIKDDGNVVDLTGSDTYVECNNVFFSDYGKLLYDNEDTSVVYEVDIPSSDINYGVYNSTSNGRVIYPTGTHAGFSSGEIRLLGRNMSEGGKLITKGAFAFDANGASEVINGLTLFDREESDPAKRSLVAYATTSYNTGYMPGDIKGAFLSDTDTTNATELITNGYFNSDVSGWTIGSTGTTATLSSNRMLITAPPPPGSDWEAYVYQAITTEIGKTYKIELYYDRGSVDGRIVVRNDSSNTVSGALFYEDLGTSQDGKTYWNTFTATATTTYILLYAKSSGGTSVYDRVSVTLEKDRSVVGKGFRVYGTVTKSPVATGADLVAYSGWSTSNYLVQSYNSDFDLGTGDFCIALWTKRSNSSTQVILEKGNGSSNRFYLYISSSNDIRFSCANQGTSIYGNLPTTDWYQIVILRRSGTVYGYLNGEFKVSNSNALLAQTVNAGASDDDLFLGKTISNQYPYSGSLALLRVSGTAPSAEQIKKMYQDEKCLFEENAKSTLYGSSDAVTALAFDEATNLLHVGTSGGRSDFQGLRRINNTTTAVTTAISAHDEFIIEQ